MITTFILATSLLAFAADSFAADREAPPPGGPAKPFTLPARQDTTLPNGMKVTLVPYGSTPKVTLTAIVHSGRFTEAADQTSLTDLVTKLMKEGTATRTSEQIAQEAAAMGGTLEIAVGADETAFSMDVLAEFAPRAAALLADVLQHPSFPAADLERLKGDMARQIAIARSTPNSIASERFRALLFPEHAYGRTYPSNEQLQAYGLEAVRAYYAKNFGAARTHLYAAGKLDASLAPAVAKAFTGWSAGAEPRLEPAHPSYTRRVDVIDRPGAAQSTLYMGLPVVDPTNADYIALQVLDSLLGGSFGSRITSNIREQKGYTYSPQSTIVPRAGTAYWAEIADVTTAVTGPSMTEIFKEIDRIRTEAPSAEELRNIQSYLAGIFVLRNSSRQGVIRQLAFVDRYGLGDQYLATYVQKILAVTPADIQKMGEKYIQPSKMTMVVVGDKSKIATQLPQ
jgi:zinc protease